MALGIPAWHQAPLGTPHPSQAPNSRYHWAAGSNRWYHKTSLPATRTLVPKNLIDLHSHKKNRHQSKTSMIHLIVHDIQSLISSWLKWFAGQNLEKKLVLALMFMGITKARGKSCSIWNFNLLLTFKEILNIKVFLYLFHVSLFTLLLVTVLEL